MRMALGSRVGPIGPGDLAAAYPWPAAGSWLRVMMVMTLDGAVAGADGRSRSISSQTDREVLLEVRRLSDAILVGASTVRAEPYAPLRARPDAAAERASLGLAPAPVIVVVSASLDLPWDAPMFGASTVRPMVVTTESAGEEGRRAARRHADLLVLPGDHVEPRDLLDRMAQAGLRRLVCEGGPGLVSTLAAGGVVDEVDLSISPLLSGGVRPPGGPPLPEPAGFALRHVLTDGEFLFNRYVALERAGSGAHA
jgi:riboflavin-specific deaminase-like protein